MAIWLHWLGYFLSYIPFTYLVKSASAKLSGWQILAASTMGCAASMVLIWTVFGFWKHFRWRLPPRLVLVPEEGSPYRSGMIEKMTRGPINPAVYSGLATSGIIISTALGYALHGASAVFMAILMKVGTLIMAPIIDAITKRRISSKAKTALSLAIGAALVTFIGKSLAVTVAAFLINLVYLGCYAIKLRLIADRKGDIRFMITDQTVAVFTSLIMVMIAGQFFQPIASGFSLLHRGDLWLIGGLSQLTGIFGCLMFLAPQEHSFCVPLNRAGSILATIVATLCAGRIPPTPELVGAALVIGAIGVLTRKDQAVLPVEVPPASPMETVYPFPAAAR